MKRYQTTFVGLFDGSEDGRPAITSIEIPIIQRDFAQGRPDDEATPIRERFLDAIVRAVTTDADMGLGAWRTQGGSRPPSHGGPVLHCARLETQ